MRDPQVTIHFDGILHLDVLCHFRYEVVGKFTAKYQKVVNINNDSTHAILGMQNICGGPSLNFLKSLRNQFEFQLIVANVPRLRAAI